MGTTPAVPPGANPDVPAEEHKAKPKGRAWFHLTCAQHGDLGEYEQEADALASAAEHLRSQHASAVEAKVAGVGVQLHEVTHFTVADLQAEEKTK